MSRYVDVVITRETKPVSEKGFGLPLMLATSKALPYTIYTGIEDVAVDFGETTAEYKLLSRMFGQSPKPAEIAAYGVSYVPGVDEPASLAAALNDLIQTHNEFYYLVSPENGDAEIKALAGWISTQEKLYGVTTQSIALTEELSGLYDNVFLSVHDQLDAYHAEGLIAMNAPKVIGSYTWTFKQVQGVPAANLTNAEISQVLANNATVQINEAGILLNAKGVSTSGEYIDNIQATHFLKARITEDIFRLLATKEKVPYTNEGIAVVVDVLETRLKSAFRQGIIATNDAGEPDYVITYPLRSEIPTNSIAQRTLPEVNFRAIVAGAIEKVQINGVLAL